MSLLTVVKYPSPILRKKSVEVREFTPWLQDLVQSMFETMYAERGIGLAAAQIGESLNLFVMDAQCPDPADPENPQKIIHNKICMVNPKIIKAEGLTSYEEGCLSCPELIVMVERSRDIVVTSLTPEGQPQQHSLTGLEAVCTQHEMDHLKGILLVDKLSRLKREMYSKNLIRPKKSDKDAALLA
jgi:peptide deformylase